MTSDQILSMCIKTHDPNNVWNRFAGGFDINIVREGQEKRDFTVSIDKRKDLFCYAQNKGEMSWIQGLKKGKFYYRISPAISNNDSIKSALNITPERTQYLKEVYEYLLGIPMILKNDVHFLHEKVFEVNFNNSDCYRLTFEYLPKDDNETWYFYIEKSTFLLRGYKFYHKTELKDGEFIFLKDYTEMDNILIPTTRMWHWNKDESYFRTDKILKSGKAKF